MPGLSADFREEKRITLLREPLVSRGSILFAPPDRLLLQVASPIPSTVLLEGDRLSLASGGDRQSLYIGSHPLLKGMSESIRLLLAGDTATLEQRFEMRSQQRSDGREGWELVLAPREAPLRSSIRSMRICGMASKLAEFEVSEANGDSTTLVFSSVNASRNFSASEIAEIFRLPAR